MQTNTLTKKNSLARNLHRLRTVVHFIKHIMFLLAKDPQASLSTAVSEAYNATLSVYHGTIVRGTCQAGFLLLPSREAFLDSIGETGAALLCFSFLLVCKTTALLSCCSAPWRVLGTLQWVLTNQLVCRRDFSGISEIRGAGCRSCHEEHRKLVRWRGHACFDSMVLKAGQKDFVMLFK